MRTPMHIHTHLRIPVHTCAHRHTPAYTRVHQRTPAHTVHTRVPYAHPPTPTHIPHIPADALNLINHMKLHVNRKKAEDRKIEREIPR